MDVPDARAYEGLPGPRRPELSVERIDSPGAEIVAPAALVPEFDHPVRLPSGFVATTLTTPEQLAGVDVDRGADSLPAATTTVEPREVAKSIALANVDEQRAVPPRDRLITFAGFGLSGTPETLPPAAQMMPSEMSEETPPHLPSTRTARTFTFGDTPEIPIRFPCWAPMIPATCVPCHDDCDSSQREKPFC